MTLHLSPLVIIFTILCTAYAAFLSHSALAVFNDGVRPFLLDFHRGELSRSQMTAIAFGLSAGFIFGLGVPIALSSGVLNPWILFLPSDILGIADRFRVVELDVAQLRDAHEPGCQEEAHHKLVVVGHMEPTVTAGVVVCLAGPGSDVIRHADDVADSFGVDIHRVLHQVSRFHILEGGVVFRMPLPVRLAVAERVVLAIVAEFQLALVLF